MITITDKHLCCGCSACVQSCPKHCIEMREDEEGFLYPQVQVDKCYDCGLCEKICPVLNQHESIEPLEIYLAQNTNEDELLKSSSGGIFILLAKQVLQEEGVVFGVKFDENWNAIHAFAETEEDVKQFMGSKYVQSRIGNTYNEAREFLLSGRQVLYSGTPCQIAGLKRYLRKDYDNLLTVDIICHGVPSPMVWQRYLEEIKQNYRLSEYHISSSSPSNVFNKTINTKDVIIKNISFRDKHLGWKNYSLSLSFYKSSDKNIKTSSLTHSFREDSYMKLFLLNYILRPSCYHCPSKGGKSQSDVTIADFWGIEKVHPECDDNRGVGMILVNSKKGRKFIDKLDLSRQGVSHDAIIHNPSYFYSVTEPINRNRCFSLLIKTSKSMGDIARLLNHTSLFVRIMRKIKYTIQDLIG